MSEKNNTNPHPEMKDEELDKVVAGGTPPVRHPGDQKILCKCWVCETEYWYAPGLNLGNLDDPWRHFCSPACKQKYDNRYIGQPGNPRP